ncbi:galactosylceramide sulfotransferase isoform X2 [Periophthalmus magnuspinnatus]|nr:galactosylceramide sulfotransferase isoform X2 [Periophthalmus magnuspinnatus]
MFGIKGRKRLLIRGSILWILLANVMVLLYCYTDQAHVKTVDSEEQTCRVSVSRPPVHHVVTTPFHRPPCSPKVNIMFMKTHKTASSTLLNILFRFGEKHKLKFAFPDGRNDFFYPSPFTCSQVKDYKPGNCFNVVCNHMRFNHSEVSKLLPPDAVYITILRDPVHLFESSFHYYHRAVPLTWKLTDEDKLAEFLNNPTAFYSKEAFNSFYLKNLLFFDFGFDNNLQADDSQVTEAISSLSKRFQLVLLAEYFDQSLILLKELLCWTMEDVLYFKLNTRRSSSVSRLTPDVRAKAQKWNDIDWKLYQYFNDTFWQKVRAYGIERMKEDVNELRRRNAEMKSVCIEGGHAVEARNIEDRHFRPWQPLGESSILGYNMKKDIDPKYKTICKKMLTPEIQYLADLGVNLWLTRLWGWIKDYLISTNLY